MTKDIASTDLLGSIHRLIKSLHKAKDAGEILMLANQEITVCLSLRTTWIFLRNSDNPDLLNLLVHGGKYKKLEDSLPKLSISGDKMLEEAFNGGGVVYVEDARTDERTDKRIVESMGNITLVNTLISLHGKKLGILGAGSFYDEGVIRLDEEQLKYFDVVAAMVAVALDRITLLELSDLDTLTGLHNRRAVLAELDAHLCSRDVNSELGIIYIDLDNFKPINDAHGHAVGDLFLTAFSQRLKKHVHNGDMVARYGGDEFLLLMPDISGHDELGDMVSLLEQACCSPITVAEKTFSCKFSMGTALFPYDGDNVSSLVSVADRRMYERKSYKVN